jgi:hypothetical protein
MRRTPLLGAVATASLLFMLSACGGSGDDELSAADIQKELSATFQRGGLTEEQADCYAKIVVEKVGVEKLQDVDLSADTPPAEIQDAVGEASTQATEECHIGETG